MHTYSRNNCTAFLSSILTCLLSFLFIQLAHILFSPVMSECAWYLSWPFHSDFIKSASCICISGTKSQHLHPRVTCHFLVCANERMTVRWQRLTKYVCAALFTCLYFARFLLIQGSPTIPDALEVSCAYYYSAMFR